jgi:SAM-dependent methyltransferase
VPLVEVPFPDCLLCGGATIARNVRFGDFQLYVCKRCRFGFLDPDPTESIIGAYDETYYDRWGDREISEFVRSAKIKTFRRIIQRGTRGKVPGRLLDVGCALGHSLEAAAQLGWDAFGIDVNPAAAAGAHPNVQARITIGRADELDISLGGYDAIVSSDVIEHLRRPAEFLQSCRRLLRPDGVIILTTVDTSSVSCKLMGRAWPNYNKEHLSYFDPANLTDLMRRSGFADVRHWNTMKYLCVGYIASVLDTQQTIFFSHVARTARRVLPTSVQRIAVPLLIGEFSITGRVSSE